MDTLSIWVLFDHPRDLPNYYVVRRQFATPEGQVVTEGKAYCFRDLARARAWLEARGLYRLDRAPGDDPVILETWL